MSKPIAVLLSDVHYDLPTLEAADKVTRQAIQKANELKVRLIVAGDLHNTKANLRGECVKVMRDTFSLCDKPPYVLIGNHDMINEKSKEHSLHFLEDLVFLISQPFVTRDLSFIPYQSDPKEFERILQDIPNTSIVICHQGICESNMGDYVQDKSAVQKQILANHRVISGHYHMRQDIKCGRPRKGCIGLASYIGNPYTLTFGEANDPEKGFQILMEDGTLEFVPTNLRKHVVIEINLVSTRQIAVSFKANDLVKVKITGTKEQLSKLNREQLGEQMGLPEAYKLELIPLTTQDDTKQNKAVQDISLDTIIESLANTSDKQKERLKTLWRSLCE